MLFIFITCRWYRQTSCSRHPLAGPFWQVTFPLRGNVQIFSSGSTPKLSIHSVSEALRVPVFQTLTKINLILRNITTFSNANIDMSRAKLAHFFIGQEGYYVKCKVNLCLGAWGGGGGSTKILLLWNYWGRGGVLFFIMVGWEWDSFQLQDFHLVSPKLRCYKSSY